MVRVRYRGGYSFTHNDHGTLSEGDIVDVSERTLEQFDYMFVPVDDNGHVADADTAAVDDSDADSDGDGDGSGNDDAPDRPAIPDDYDTLRQVASQAALDDADGRSPKADIVAALEALDTPTLRDALSAADGSASES